MLVWLRRDLRLTDNLALRWAADTGVPVIPIYIFDETPECAPPGAASRWWLHGSLRALDRSLREKGSRLILRRGRTREVIARLAQETHAAAIGWNRVYEPQQSAADQKIEQECAQAGLEVQHFNSSLLFEPHEIRSASGSYYQVFTPFWKQCCMRDFTPPTDAPRSIAAPASWPQSEALDDWHLQPRDPDWASGLRDAWQPGEAGASRQLDAFADSGVKFYAAERNLPDRQSTSRLSPHLHFGELGPRQINARLKAAHDSGSVSPQAFIRQLGWREFGHHLAMHQPDIGAVNMRSEFDAMPWRDDPQGLRRWQRGQTGYPLVDAGMRELWRTGWMHNRVRMVTASFLIKHLLIDWRLGADWFLDTLVDADWVNNSLGWQWVAGSGADGAPYFRIFNPITQSQKFDARGRYLRTWLPELGRLPDKLIHAPWQASADELANAGIRLGVDYPLPMVAHDEARKRALTSYEEYVRSPAKDGA